MNFNCQKEDLLFAAQIIGKAISARNTMPILAGILMIAEEGQLTMRATDLDVAMQCAIPADVAEPGHCRRQAVYRPGAAAAGEQRQYQPDQRL